MDRPQRWEFEEFVRTVKPRLLRAFAGCRGEDAGEATAEALAYAWEHWERVGAMDNPAGYLFRVGQSRTRRRRTPRLYRGDGMSSVRVSATSTSRVEPPTATPATPTSAPPSPRPNSSRYCLSRGPLAMA